MNVGQTVAAILNAAADTLDPHAFIIERIEAVDILAADVVGQPAYAAYLADLRAALVTIALSYDIED